MKINSPKIWRWLLGLQLLVMLIIMSTAYMGKPIVEYKGYDLYLHFLLFGFTSYLAYRASNRKKIAFTYAILPFWPLIFLLFSCTEECLQAFSSHRTFSLLDMSANILGITSFYLIDRFWIQKSAV